MLFSKKSRIFIYSLTLLPSVSFSESFNFVSEYITIDGSIELSIPQNDSNKNKNSVSEYKKISFMKIEPTLKMLDKIQQANEKMLFNGGELDYSSGITKFKDSEGAVDIGMENVPVLDQGQYGTCVTFASTAALDARFKMGDYLDQQCSLALDLTLGNNYWHGAYTANEVILPLKKYGFIAKGYCFGSKYSDPNQTVNLNQYIDLSFKGYSNAIVTKNMRPDIDAIKKALDSKFRVAIGFLYNSDYNTKMINKDGSVVSQNRGGLWSCYQPSDPDNRCVKTNSGHEVLVIGYDDRQQLLKIRNSWSSNMGDNGDYYMTYNFFSAMANDQTIIQ